MRSSWKMGTLGGRCIQRDADAQGDGCARTLPSQPLSPLELRDHRFGSFKCPVWAVAVPANGFLSTGPHRVGWQAVSLPLPVLFPSMALAWPQEHGNAISEPRLTCAIRLPVSPQLLFWSQEQGLPRGLPSPSAGSWLRGRAAGM